jgi:precorrin-4 methylase
MAYPAIEHLAHIQQDLVDGIKMETKETILAQYSWSDQMNAKGTAKTAMQSDIADLVTAGATKQAAVLAATTFEELNAVVPMASEEE